MDAMNVKILYNGNMILDAIAEDQASFILPTNGKYLAGNVVVNVKYPALPKAYQQVEYIQSTGTQYIDVGNIDVQCLIKTKVSFLDLSSNIYIYGQWETNGVKAYLFVNETSNTLQWGNGNDYKVTSFSVNANTEYEIEHDLKSGQQSLKVNTDADNNMSNYSYTQFRGIIFGGIQNGTIRNFSSIKLNYFKIYDSQNSLIHSFIPCYRKSDNEAGMYDLVNDVFYTNAGSGTFTVGPDVN